MNKFLILLYFGVELDEARVTKEESWEKDEKEQQSPQLLRSRGIVEDLQVHFETKSSQEAPSVLWKEIPLKSKDKRTKESRKKPKATLKEKRKLKKEKKKG